MKDDEFEQMCEDILRIVQNHPKRDVIGVLECMKLTLWTLNEVKP